MKIAIALALLGCALVCLGFAYDAWRYGMGKTWKPLGGAGVLLLAIAGALIWRG